MCGVDEYLFFSHACTEDIIAIGCVYSKVLYAWNFEYSLQFQTAKTVLFSFIETYLQLTTIIPPLPNIARNIS